MSYLQSLLDQKDPLTPYEKDELTAWLGVLEEDVARFGITTEDARRMNAIRAKLQEAPAQ